jgi:hypothetical protein
MQRIDLHYAMMTILKYPTSVELLYLFNRQAPTLGFPSGLNYPFPY